MEDRIEEDPFMFDREEQIMLAALLGTVAAALKEGEFSLKAEDDLEYARFCLEVAKHITKSIKD